MCAFVIIKYNEHVQDCASYSCMRSCPLFNSARVKNTGISAKCRSNIKSLVYEDYHWLFCDIESLEIRNKSEAERIFKYKEYVDFICCDECYSKIF